MFLLKTVFIHRLKNNERNPTSNPNNIDSSQPFPNKPLTSVSSIKDVPK